MGSPDDEQDWIRQSQRGDHEAFAVLLTRYQRMIYSLTFRMSGSFADADDLTQETFIQAFRRLERFRIHGLVFPPNPTNAPALANE